jgi:predicted RNA binding protein YcfA (HicA-like mRNA interferase family)
LSFTLRECDCTEKRFRRQAPVSPRSGWLCRWERSHFYHRSIDKCLPFFPRRSLVKDSFSFPASISKPSQPLLDVKVREIIKELERDGWVQVRHRGSHRRYHHPTKPGTVTVPGAMADDLRRELLGSFMRQAGIERRR